MIRLTRMKAEVVEFSETMVQFLRTLYSAQLRRFHHVAEVYTTEKLEGVTLGEFQNEFLDKFEEHRHTHQENTHHTTTGQIDPS